MFNDAKPCAGVYRIIAPSGNFYIGSSVNMRVRVRAHKFKLRAGIHYNKKLQAAFNKYGGDLRAETVCVFDGDRAGLIALEQTYLNLKPKYNISKVAGLPSTYPDTPKKISAALMGRHRSEATKAKLREAAKSRPPASEETRAKMSAAGRGRKKTPEHIAKIAAASAKFRHTEETKERLRQIRLNGRPPREKSPGLGRGRGSPGYPKRRRSLV